MFHDVQRYTGFLPLQDASFVFRIAIIRRGDYKETMVVKLVAIGILNATPCSARAVWIEIMTLLVGIHTMCLLVTKALPSENACHHSVPLLVNKVCMLSAGALVTIIEAEELYASSVFLTFPSHVTSYQYSLCYDSKLANG